MHFFYGGIDSMKQNKLEVIPVKRVDFHYGMAGNDLDASAGNVQFN